MADKVDMSLDDIIKMNKKSKPQFKNGSFLRGPAGRRPANNQRQQSNVVRNNQSRSVRRSNPYSRPAPIKTGDRWKHDLFDGNNKPARLMIGNLHFRVSDNDIKELFKEFGVIKKAVVYYDKSGRSLGNAEVVFANRISARKALDKYNDVLLDGRKMKITLVSDKPVVQASSPRKPMIGSRLNQGNNRQPRRNGMARSNGGGGGGKPANKRQPAPTKEQLDADLDAYVNKN